MALWEFPTTSLDSLATFQAFSSSYWIAGLFGSIENILDINNLFKVVETQLLEQSQEMQASVGLQTCPVWHTSCWYPVTIFQSQGTPGNPLLYGAGELYGPQPSNQPSSPVSSLTGQSIGLLSAITYSSNQPQPIPTNGLTYLYGQNLDSTIKYPLPGEVSEALYLASGITNPSVTWALGVDFEIASGESLILTQNPFSNALLNPTAVTNTLGDIIDYSLTLWLFRAKLDWGYLYQNFGSVLGIGQSLPSTPNYKRLLEAYWSSAQGTTYENVVEALSAMCDVPFVKSTGETVEIISEDSENLLIITDQQVYKLALTANPLVQIGQTLVEGQALADSVQIFEPRRGILPSVIGQITLDDEFLLTDLSNILVFANVNESLNVQTNVQGYTKLSWNLGGFPSDIATFFSDLHENGVEAGNTLANYLRTSNEPYPWSLEETIWSNWQVPWGQTQPLPTLNWSDESTVWWLWKQPWGQGGPTNQPTASQLPTNINPAQFLVANVLRDDCLLISVKPDEFGPAALGLQYSWVFREMLPPQTTAIIIGEVAGYVDTCNAVAGATSSYTVMAVPGQ